MNVGRFVASIVWEWLELYHSAYGLRASITVILRAVSIEVLWVLRFTDKFAEKHRGLTIMRASSLASDSVYQPRFVNVLERPHRTCPQAPIVRFAATKRFSHSPKLLQTSTQCVHTRPSTSLYHMCIFIDFRYTMSLSPVIRTLTERQRLTDAVMQ